MMLEPAEIDVIVQVTVTARARTGWGGWEATHVTAAVAAAAGCEATTRAGVTFAGLVAACVNLAQLERAVPNAIPMPGPHWPAGPVPVGPAACAHGRPVSWCRLCGRVGDREAGVALMWEAVARVKAAHGG